MQGARGKLKQKICARPACSRIFNTFHPRFYRRNFCAVKHEKERAEEAEAAQQMSARDRVLAVLAKEGAPMFPSTLAVRLSLTLERIKALLKGLRADKRVRLLRTPRGSMYTNHVAAAPLLSEKASSAPEEPRTSDPAGEPSNKPPAPPLLRRAHDVEYEVIWDGSHGALPGHAGRSGLGSSLNPKMPAARILRNKQRGT